MQPTISDGVRNLLNEKQGDEFRSFLSKHAHIQKWMISADFCFDKNFKNKTYALTIIPIVAPIGMIIDKINKCMPKDIKKIKNVSNAAISLINDKNFFHFGFVVNDPVAAFSNASSDSNSYILDTIEQTYKSMTAAGLSKDQSKPFRLLKEESKAKRFNVVAYSQLMIFSAILTALVITMSKNTSLNLVGVFPDRDAITIQHDGLYIELVKQSINDHFIQQEGRSLPFEIGRGVPNETGKIMWYDELIRLPDYIANLVAQWDMKTLPNTASKISPLFYNAYVDSRNLTIVNLRHGDPLYIDFITAKNNAQ